MPAIQIPGTNIVYGWQEREKGWGPGMNTNLLVLGQVARGSVITRQQSVAPTSPAEGDAYIVPVEATGEDWVGQDNKIAVYHSEKWLFIEPFGSPVYVQDEGQHIYWTGTEYGVVAGAGDVRGPADSADREIPVFSGLTGKLLGRSPWRTDENGNLYGGGIKPQEITASRALTPEDNGLILWTAAVTPVTVTLPDNATTALPAGFNCILVQTGDGSITATGEGGDGVLNAGNTTKAPGKAVSVIKLDSTYWWTSAEETA